MNAEMKRKKLNELMKNYDLDAECENEICLYVFIELTDEVKKVLNEIGYDDAFIEMNKNTKDFVEGKIEVFDLCNVAWDFADWFTGDTFIDKESEG